MALPESTAGKIRNSTKFLSEGYSNDSEIFTIQMAQAVGTEMFVPCTPAPPLTYYYGSIEAILRAAEAGFETRILTDIQLSHIGDLKVKFDGSVTTLEV